MKASVFNLLLIIFVSFPAPGQDIHELSKKGDIKMIRELLEKDKTLLGSTDGTGYTPLHWALIRAKWDLAEYLISQGADVTIAGTEGGTPLHCAANHDNPDIINLLVRKGAVIDARNLWGNTPLALAAQRGCGKTVKALIDAGAGINTKSEEGWTPLHYACKSGHENVKQILISHQALDTIKDNTGKTASQYIFVRPEPITTKCDMYKEYTGLYFIAPGSFFRVYLEDEKLFLEDFALDEIYPVAYDQFYDYREPWKIRFFRNQAGEVDVIAVDFQRQTVVGKKVNSEEETPSRPRLGIATRSLRPEDINTEALNTLFFDMKANANALLVTQVGENTPAFRAGIRVNDIILEFGNETLTNPGDLIRMLYNVDVGQEVVAKILRNNNIKYVGLSFKQ